MTKDDEDIVETVPGIEESINDEAQHARQIPWRHSSRGVLTAGLIILINSVFVFYDWTPFEWRPINFIALGCWTLLHLSLVGVARGMTYVLYGYIPVVFVFNMLFFTKILHSGGMLAGGLFTILFMIQIYKVLQIEKLKRNGGIIYLPAPEEKRAVH